LNTAASKLWARVCRANCFAYGVVGLIVAILGILVYLWFRFEWQFAPVR
jgi:hypothetical protein